MNWWTMNWLVKNQLIPQKNISCYEVCMCGLPCIGSLLFIDDVGLHNFSQIWVCFIRQWNVLKWPNQSPDLNPVQHAFHFLMAKHPKNKQKGKTTAVKAWLSFTRDETQHLMMSVGSRLQAVKRICNQIFKMTISFMIIVLLPITFGLLKMGQTS